MAKMPIENTAKAAKKALDKETRVMIERTGEYYYISGGGYWLLKIPAVVYEAYFRPLAAYFIPMDDGGAAELERTRDVMPMARPTGWNFAQIMEQTATVYAPSEAHVLPLVYETDARNIRLVSYEEGARVTGLDDAFYKIIAPLAFTTATTAGRFSAVYFGGNDYAIEAIILPIRMERNKPEDFFPAYTTLAARNVA